MEYCITVGKAKRMRIETGSVRIMGEKKAVPTLNTVHTPSVHMALNWMNGKMELD